MGAVLGMLGVRKPEEKAGTRGLRHSEPLRARGAVDTCCVLVRHHHAGGSCWVTVCS